MRMANPVAAERHDSGQCDVGDDHAVWSGECDAAGADRTPSQLGQIQLATFPNPGGLERAGLEPASHRPRRRAIRCWRIPGRHGGLGTLQQGYLENSNVDVVAEFVQMVLAQRAYESNSKVMRCGGRHVQPGQQYGAVRRNWLERAWAMNLRETKPGCRARWRAGTVLRRSCLRHGSAASPAHVPRTLWLPQGLSAVERDSDCVARPEEGGLCKLRSSRGAVDGSHDGAVRATALSSRVECGFLKITSTPRPRSGGARPKPAIAVPPVTRIADTGRPLRTGRRGQRSRYVGCPAGRSWMASSIGDSVETSVITDLIERSNETGTTRWLVRSRRF